MRKYFYNKKLKLFFLLFATMCLNTNANANLVKAKENDKTVATFSIYFEPDQSRFISEIHYDKGCYINPVDNQEILIYPLNQKNIINSKQTRKTETIANIDHPVITRIFTPIELNEELTQTDIRIDICCNKICHSITAEADLDKSGDITLINTTITEYQNNKQFSKIEILRVVLIAFVVGFIANFMPCVLPVLGIKLQSFAKMNSNQSVIRFNLFASFCGILLTFIIMGFSVSFVGILFNLKTITTSNSDYIWGSHLQNTNFILIIAIIIFILYQINEGKISLPLDKLSVSTRNKSEIILSFINGIIGTLLATPCMAPLLGAAFIMSQGNVVLTLIIFTSSGFGFGLPYILLMFKTNIAILTKSKFKEIMGIIIPSFITVTIVWLIYILNGQVGIFGALFVFIVVFGTNLLLGKVISKAVKWLLILAMIFLLFAGISLIGDLSDRTSETQSNWQELSLEDIDKEILNSNVVLVNITADWCVVCKLNKFTTLNSDLFTNFVAKNKVILMEGDVTKTNQYVAKYLKSIGINGVPVLMLYSEKNPTGRLLDTVVNPFYLNNEIEKELS